MANDGWVNVTKDNPCQVCTSDHWCRVSADGQVACCKRVSDGSFKPGKREGWLHRLIDNPMPQQPRYFPKQKKRLTDAEMHAKWAPQARHYFRGRQDKVNELAVQLGVAKWTLDALMVGYAKIFGKMCWTFPERNSAGWIVGVRRRFVVPIDGKDKMCMPDARPALTYVDNWADYPGPVLIVEGGSDTAAGLTLQRAVVGRPSCTGGVEYLVRLLGKLPPKRRIIVVAERDRKKHEDLSPKVKARHWQRCPGCMQCWPGRSGATATAKRLTKRLGRRVIWLLPSGAKDLRDWLNQQGLDVEDTDAMAELGKQVLA